MNLNISYNWLKSFVKIHPAEGLGASLTPQEFAKRISLSGPSVDRIAIIKPSFEKVVVGQIMTIEQHPNADKLHVCKVSVAPDGIKTTIPQGKSQLQIVCGAPNIEVGQKVPVVLVGGKVGKSAELPEGFEIKEAKLRGVESFGMMCSQKELGLGEDHAGIFILPEDSKVGVPLESIMPLEDAILDMEVTSNRPDAMSVIGIAREAAAILDAEFLYQPAKPSLTVTGTKHDLKVKVNEQKLCSRYSAIVMSDVKVAGSPLWMQQRLIASGIRPINNLVDITNYILLEYGQPMHVFDYDKLGGASINVRLAKAGEKILALDGKEYELSADQLVIADAKDPVAVAGVMGGELSAATAATKSIVFECANFNPVSVRKTSRALNLRSESSALYEKGISPENVTAAMLRAIELAQELCGAKVASKLIDEKSYKYKPQTIDLNLEKVNQVLGISLKATDIKKYLEALGFEVAAGKKDAFKVTIPWWREGDIEGQHDLVEEIARMHGYHNLPTQLMSGALPQTKPSTDFALEDKVKDILAGFGLTEIYTYSFISEKQIKGAGFDPAKHFKIANPLSIDFEYMRTSLVPGTLQIIADNQGFYPEAKLFDLSAVYERHAENDLAAERFKLLLAVYGNNDDKVLTDLKGLIDGLEERLNLPKIDYVQVPGDDGGYWTVGATVDAFMSKHGFWGRVALVNERTKTNFGIKKSVAIAEFYFDQIIESAQPTATYQPIPKFPAIELDLSMEIDNVVTFAEVANIASDAGAPLVEEVKFLSVYQGDSLPENKKALAIRIIYRDLSKTLELAEAQTAHNKVVEELKKSYNISVR